MQLVQVHVSSSNSVKRRRDGWKEGGMEEEVERVTFDLD
jgi:hypothetical protein